MENYYNFSFIYYVPSHISIDPMQGLIDNYDNFFSSHQEDWTKLVNSRYLTDYTPNSNYNITENVDSTNTLTGTDKTTITKGVTTTTETVKKQSIQTTDTVTDTYTYDEDITHLNMSGSETNGTNSSDTTSVTPYSGGERNLNSVTSTSNNTLSYDGREDLTRREAHTDTVSKDTTSTVSYVGTEPDKTTVTNNGSDTDVTEKNNTSKDTITRSKEGYIGISPIDTITKEWNERIEKSLTYYICKQFCKETFFLFEGCDVDDIEFI